MESSNRRSVSPTTRPAFLTRPASPTRVIIPSPQSVQLLLPSPRRQIAINKNPTRKTCLCSPTTHPGSFRCSLHKNNNNSRYGNSSINDDRTVAYQSHRLNARRSAMTNSLVRIGTVEGDLVRRALAALIRPSSHQQRRRADFRPRPSRLSVMSKAQ